ncbi:MAG: transcriptional regulator GutM [Anaerovibrio sp.]|nr:transcriptional regulator GutM [Anaerovibrio sp.]
MLKVGLLIAAMFVLQTILSGMQMRRFSREFIRLRRQGRVVCGRQSGGFHAGAIVMFRIDGEGIICEASKLEGVTCFARIRPLAGFAGKHVGTLTEQDLPAKGRNLRRAILDARGTYNRYMAGEEIPDPPSPFQRLKRTAAILLGR